MARGGFHGMMGGGGNMQQLARQAQKLQQQMTKVQEELEAREYEASAGGGMVTVKVTGKKELVALEIKPEAVDPDDVEMLQDMVMAAASSRTCASGRPMMWYARRCAVLRPTPGSLESWLTSLAIASISAIAYPSWLAAV